MFVPDSFDLSIKTVDKKQLTNPNLWLSFESKYLSNII